MAGAGQIRAGQAFVELTIKDKTSQGLRLAQSKIAGLARGVSALAVPIAAGIGTIVTTLAGVVTAGVKTFLSVSNQLQTTAGMMNPKAVALSDAFRGLNAVMQATFFVIGAAVAGPLTSLLTWMTKATLASVKFSIALGKIASSEVKNPSTIGSAILIGAARGLIGPLGIMTAPNIDKTIEPIMKGAVKGLIGPLGFTKFGSNAIDFAFDSLKKAAADRIKQLPKLGNEQGSPLQMPLANLGGSAGTFSARGAGLLGIGSGGGMKTSDDETHKLLMETLRAIKALDVGVEFK